MRNRFDRVLLFLIVFFLLVILGALRRLDDRMDGLAAQLSRLDRSSRPAAMAETRKVGFPDRLKDLARNWREMDVNPAENYLVYQALPGLRFRETTGSVRERLLPGVFLPRLSPDRRTLFALARESGTEDVHLISFPFGGEAKELCRMRADNVYYDVSPDRKEVVFGRREGNLTQLYRRTLKTGTEARFTSGETGGMYPMYSPDGKWIAYCASKKLRIRSTETTEERVLVDDPSLKELPTWSPDGQWIAWQGRAEDDLGFDIWKVRVSDGATERLTREPGTDANPCFSRDGSQLVFGSERQYVAQTGYGTEGEQMRLYVMNADGSDVTPLPDSPTIYFPRW